MGQRKTEGPYIITTSKLGSPGHCPQDSESVPEPARGLCANDIVLRIPGDP